MLFDFIVGRGVVAADDVVVQGKSLRLFTNAWLSSIEFRISPLKFYSTPQ